MKKIKLFCLAHAGGSASIFLKWKKYLSGEIEVVPLELAGRGIRWDEKQYELFDECVNDIYPHIVHNIDCEYAIFGHSMGADLAFELTRKLQDNGERIPLHLFLSARKSPLVHTTNTINQLPDDEFIHELVLLGGTDEETFKLSENRVLFLPIIRGDYHMLDTYQYKPVQRKLDVDFSILSGSDDKLKIEDISSWKDLTSRKCYFKQYEGGHFYIEQKYNEVTQYIYQMLQTKSHCV